MINAKPPTRSAQFPDSPNHASKECGSRPSVAPTPAMIAPETMVMPPKYVNAISASAASAPKRL